MKTIYQALAELETKNEAAALCTVVGSQGSTPRHSTSKMLVYEDGSFIGTVGGGELENRVFKEAQEALNDGKSRLLEYNMADPARGDPGVCGGTVEVFVEPILPAPTLVVIGGGHVGKAVAHLAKWLNFRVAVSDDRPEFVTPEASPDADAFYECKMEELPRKSQDQSTDLSGIDHAWRRGRRSRLAPVTRIGGSLHRCDRLETALENDGG